MLLSGSMERGLVSLAAFGSALLVLTGCGAGGIACGDINKSTDKLNEANSYVREKLNAALKGEPDPPGGLVEGQTKADWLAGQEDGKTTAETVCAQALPEDTIGSIVDNEPWAAGQRAGYNYVLSLPSVRFGTP